MGQLEEFRRREFPVTGEQPRESISDISRLLETFKFGEYIGTTTNFKEDKSTLVYKFGEYSVEVKLDSEGRLIYIQGYPTPEPKKYYAPLFRLDEEFPESKIE